MQLSRILVGLVLLMSFVAVFGMFIGTGVTQFSVDYDNETMAAYNQLASLNNDSLQIKQSIDSDEVNDDNTFDLLGEYFKAGYRTMKVSFSSIDVFFDIQNKALDDLNIGNSEVDNVLRTMIMIILTILIFIGIIVGVLVVKKQAV